MTNEHAAFFGRPDFKRGRYGWAEIAQPDGGTKLYKRVTTVAGYMDDKQGLIEWTAAKVAAGVAQNKGLQSSFALLSWEDDKTKIKDLVAKAKAFGGGDDSADRGTAFHKVVEMYHGGQSIDPDLLPDGFEAALEAYKTFVAEKGIEVVGTELTIVDDANELAGTADLIYTFAKAVKTPYGTIKKGTGIIADVKTGSVSELSGLKMGLQLGIYSHGQPYDAGTDQRTDWPVEINPDIGLILKVDLDAGTVTPWWLDLKGAYSLLPLAFKIDQARKNGKKLIAAGEIESAPAPAKKAPAKPTAKEIREAMGAAETLDELIAVRDKYGEFFTKAQSDAFDTRYDALADAAPADEDETPAPPTDGTPWEEPKAQEAAPEPPADDYGAEHAQRASAAAHNRAALADVYKDFARHQASPDVLKVITDRAAELK